MDGLDGEEDSLETDIEWSFLDIISSIFWVGFLDEI
jgi:hypothetical protein